MALVVVVLAAFVVVAGLAALAFILRERRRHERAERENLLLEADRDEQAERATLMEQILGAEQDERRRLANELHDGAVQSLAGVALMLDAATHFVEEGQLEQASDVLTKALERHRRTISELRDLSFNLEPVVLRDQGFGSAVAALAEQRALEHGIKIDVEADAADSLAEKVQAALYQIIRETLDGSIRRGPPTWVSIQIAQRDDRSIETVIVDDAPGERRRRSLDALEERARTLGGAVSVESRDGEGTTIRLALPPYAAGG
ncbi:MAG TPA: histidine kinase [Gaiellaceae bacterium]|jgi:signal transduction histidine kinase